MPFEVILVWKFSSFTRNREHEVAFKSMLRRKGVKIVSITKHASDFPTGKPWRPSKRAWTNSTVQSEFTGALVGAA